MIQLRALTAHLIEANLVLPEQLDSWVDQFNLDLIWTPTGNGGMHMAICAIAPLSCSSASLATPRC